MRNTPARVLIVDDTEDIRFLLCHIVQGEGMEAIEAMDGETALQLVRRHHPDVMLLDIRLPVLDGPQVLLQVQALDSSLPVILITAFGSIENAVRMMKNGAYDYLTKPFVNEKVVQSIRRALHESHLKPMTQSAGDQLPLEEIMGPSGQIGHLAAEVARVAPTDFSVVITGETGAGKEVVARGIHWLSGRSQLVALDCGAIPETLIESELFGYEKGAFTGASRTQEGKFELARGGTLFFDEISNLPLSMQTRLLRVLQEKRFFRVGGIRPITADTRIITATNQTLDPDMYATPFRQDLYHRLCEYPIQVPPLRDRKEDIPFLAGRFVNSTNRELQKNVREISAAALNQLLAYDWPGNVRELRNTIRRGVLVADEIIQPQHLNGLSTKVTGGDLPMGVCAGGVAQSEEGQSTLKEILERHASAVEKDVIAQTLIQTAGNKAAAARLLHIDYKTIHTKIKKYAI